MKEYIISAAYTNFEDEWEVEKLNHISNWFLVKDEPKKISGAEIDKNFYSLCSLMEENGSINPSQYSVIQFYAKLDYINKKIERENSSINNNNFEDYGQ